MWHEGYAAMEDGARLYYRERGTGKTLLLIHGVACDSDFFLDAGELLARQFHVVLYDRRGYARSGGGEALEGLDAEGFFRRSARDAARVLAAVGHGPAAVVGCSCGALTAMYLAEQYPERVAELVLHEPPAYALDRDNEDFRAKVEDIRKFIAAGKYTRALNRFLLLIVPASVPEGKPLSPEAEGRMEDNGLFFVRSEFSRVFAPTLRVPRLEAVGAGRCTVAIGVLSEQGPIAPCLRELSGRLGCPLWTVPGGHNAAREQPEAFSEALLELLKGSDPAGGV